MRFLGNLQNIDRRIMYLLLAVVAGIPLVLGRLETQHPGLRKFVPTPPVPITAEVAEMYDAVENIPDDKIAIISISWAASTQAENGPQTEVLVRHFFRRGIPFILVPWDPQGTTLAYEEANRIAKEMHKVYGKDWAALGLAPVGNMVQIIQGMGVNIAGTLKTDRNGTPIRDLPMMKGKNKASDIGMVVEVTASATIPVWIAFMGQPNRVPIGYCPTSVMVPEAHNYLDAKQVVGMLPGVIGAAQYEEKLGVKDGFGLRAAPALSASHLLIILLIILGNTGYFLARRRSAQTS